MANRTLKTQPASMPGAVSLTSCCPNKGKALVSSDPDLSERNASPTVQKLNSIRTRT